MRARKARTGSRHEQAMGNQNGLSKHWKVAAHAPRNELDPAREGMTDWIPGEAGGR